MLFMKRWLIRFLKYLFRTSTSNIMEKSVISPNLYKLISMIDSKKMRSLLIGIASATIVHAQNVDKIINPTSVKNVLSVLAADDMRGRKTFTPDIDRAADYIATQFKKAGLEYAKGQNSYLQKFSMFTSKVTSSSATLNGQTIAPTDIIAISNSPHLQVNENSGYKIVHIPAGGSLFASAQKYTHPKENTIVVVDSSFATQFKRMTYYTRAMFENKYSTIFILSNSQPTNYTIDVQQELTTKNLENVVGIIPGKTKPDEYVIFSGHYDHLGVDPSAGADSIYNGANDDASGTTAVILLADYYKKKKDNARTLVFVAFTAEEVGGYGSQYFSQQMEPSKVMAMFNIEMIGTDSKWGNNSAYITGYEKTNMGEILQKNLQGSKFQFYPDPYTEQNLFYRSDNATLARQGVPAHTISTSKMDSEPNYHKLSDEISTLDLTNMAEIIKSIAVSAQTIISGKDTPTRVDSNSLK